MRKTILALLFGALVVFAFAWALWTSLDFQECIKNYTDRNLSAEHFEKGTSIFVVPISTYRHCVGAYVTDENATITAVGTLVIAIFTTVLGIFTINLAGSTRMAANAAKESADALTQSERAHIFIKIEAQDFLGVLSSANLANVTADGLVATPVTVEFRFKNYGKTPAILKEMSRDIIISADFPGKIEYFPIEFATTGRIVAADAETNPPMKCIRTRLSKRELTEIIRAQKSFWFYGRLLYDDIFGSGHEHRFIYQYSRNPDSRGWNTFRHPEYSKNT